MVTGSPVLALAFLLAPVTVGAHFTRGLTAPAPVPGCADTGSGDGVAQGSVLALTSVAAVRTPVLTVARTGAVGAPPSRLTLAGVGGHAAAMDAVLGTVRSTELSVFVKARATLRLPPVHGLLSSAVGDPITHPVSRTLEPVEDVGAAGVVDLIKRMSVRLLHCHCVTFPVAADIGVLQVQRRCDAGQEPEGHSQQDCPVAPQ